MRERLVEKITERVIGMLNETLSDDLAAGKVTKFTGRKPKTIKARINRIYKKVHEYRIDARTYKNDDSWKCVDDYCTVIESLGGETKVWCEYGGYTDRNQDGLPTSKEWRIEISYDDGMVIGGYIKAMGKGSGDSLADIFESYDTCMVLWPKPSR